MIKSKNLHLTISAIIVTVISLIYGLFPGLVLPKLFAFEVGSTDLKQVFRATMGLYLGMVVLWVSGTFKPTLWRTATITNVVFMMGLASGRIISLIVDGMPSVSFSIGLLVELTLGIWGILNLKNQKAIPIS